MRYLKLVTLIDFKELRLVSVSYQPYIPNVRNKVVKNIYKFAAPRGIIKSGDWSITMKIALFSKKKLKNDEARTPFYIYLSTLTSTSTGETFSVRVKFRQEAGNPDPNKCPRVISFDKKDANLSSETITTDDGITRTIKTLWIGKWSDAGAFVDTSLDDFE